MLRQELLPIINCNESVCEILIKNFMDADGNFISHSGSNIYIYNPNGVVGYTNVVGKIVKM